MTSTTNNTQLLDLFQRVEPRDILRTLKLNDPQCGVDGCHAKADGLAIGFNTAGEIGVAPICKAHAEARAKVYRAYSFDGYEASGLLLACCNTAAERLQAAGQYPYLIRNPDALEHAALYFHDKLGRLGYVPILMPLEPHDTLVAAATDLQHIADALLEGGSIQMMGPVSGYRLGVIDVSMNDFVLVPGKSLSGEDFAMLTTPGVHHIDIKHDDDCPTLKTGNGADCTCSPDVELRK